MKKQLFLTSRILFNVTAVAAGLSMIASAAIKNNFIRTTIGSLIHDEDIVHVEQTGKPAIYNKTWYQSVEDVLNGNGNIAKAAQSEGTVLLRNKNHALPLKTAEDKVNLYGVTAYNPIYSLDGAGEVKINKNRQQFFYDELVRDGLEVNKNLADWYNSSAAKQYWRVDKQNIYDNTSNANGFNAVLNGASWDVLPESKLTTGYNTGIFVTGRITNEGIDIMPQNVGGKGAKDNDYLKFTDNELSVLEGMKVAKAAGQLNKIVVLLNTANPYQEELEKVFDEYTVDAVLWIGHPGSDGIRAVADILVGKSSPSAGLSSTWYAGRDYNPNTPYYGNGGDMLVQEAIYLGYKYAETRYEDAVLGTGETASYSYQDAIAYPFGYGLSYSSFTQEVIGVEENKQPAKNYVDEEKTELVEAEKRRKSGDDLIMKVKVTNTGTVAAKEIVQVYVQKPYTGANKDNGVEKSSVELVGYGKTSKLEPGASETVEIEIDANKTFAAYDGVVGDYIMDEGTYYITAARNSHEAVNNILKQKKNEGVTIDETKMDSEFGAGDAAKVHAYKFSADYLRNYKYWTKGSVDVKPLFDFADPNKVGAKGSEVTYMSRKNWALTADTAKSQSLSQTGDMGKANAETTGAFTLERIQTAFPDLFDEKAFGYLPQELPAYGKNRNSDGTAGTQLYQMRGVDYNDPQWEAFLDQLTWEESVQLVSKGLRHTEAIDSIGKPYTNDVNASNAISWMFDMSVKGGAGTSNVGFSYHFDSAPAVRQQNPTGYPCEGVIAATFNNDIAYAVGQAIGEDGLWTGASGLYGFGLGLHRNPYHGRSGEYYSDDPFLAGMIGGYETKGAQSKGMYVYNKHFVLNDQETSRTGYRAWLNEQTMREVYLRPFELAIEVGNAMNVMSSFNRVGSAWSGNNYNLMTEWLRGEADMAGFIVTDYYKSGGMNMTFGLLAGTDLPDGSEGAGTFNEHKDMPVYAQGVRRSAHRILYTVANSNAMNFIGEGTTQWTEPAKWPEKFEAGVISIYVVFGISAAFMLASGIILYLPEMKKMIAKLKKKD